MRGKTLTKNSKPLKTHEKILRDTDLINLLAAFFRVTLRNYQEGKTRKWSPGLQVVKIEGFITHHDYERLAQDIIYEYSFEPDPTSEQKPRVYYTRISDGRMATVSPAPAFYRRED